MKRYGYKFERMDGVYASALDARAFSLFFGILLSIIFGIAFKGRTGFFSVGLLYFFIGFISEFFPKIGLAIALIIFALFAAVFLHSEYLLLDQCYENCTEWSRRNGATEKISTIWQSLFLGVFFLTYNLIVIWLFYIRTKSKS